MLQETLGEIALGGKARGLGDLRNTVIRSGQQLFAGLYSYLTQIIDGGATELACEGMHHIIFIQMGHLRKGIQGDILGIV